MKKILGISLVAVLAVSPLMARAEGELAVAKTIAANETETGGALTTEAYVKGAYNAALNEVRTVNNAVTTLNGNDQTAGSVLNAVKTKAAEGSYNADTNYAAGTIGHAIKNTSATAIDALDATVSKTAGADGLALEVVEENGKLVSVTGSIAAGTYDAYGTGSAIENKLDDGATGYDIDAKTLKIQGDDVATQDYVQSQVQGATADAATREGVAATVNKATASKTGASLNVNFGEIRTTLNDMSVNVPSVANVNVASTWGQAGSASTLALSGATATAVTGSATTTIAASTAEGDITGIDVAVEGYYENTADTTAETFNTQGAQ